MRAYGMFGFFLLLGIGVLTNDEAWTYLGFGWGAGYGTALMVAGFTLVRRS